jgi:hypothetical protein
MTPLRRGGQPLPSTLRAFFEPRLGRGLGHVRIHADADADASAQALGAHAYTVGRDIVFAAGKYAPDSSAGRHLLAHELTHVMQQDVGAAPPSIAQRQEAETGRAAPTKGEGQAPQAAAAQRSGDCSGWERDPQSFTKTVAEFYVRTVLQTAGTATTVVCEPFQCTWTVTTLAGELSVRVHLALVPDCVAANRLPQGPMTYFDYDCPPSGGLRLAPRSGPCL